MSELWRNVEPLPEELSGEIRCRLFRYAEEVVASDWDSMAVHGSHSPEATGRYEQIWEAFYDWDPDSLSLAEATFYQQAVGELNELGRERRRRGLLQPMVRALLIWGGVFVVLFSLLIPVHSLRVQLTVTSIISGLIAASIFLALALERPFAGDLSVGPASFERIAGSFERRAGGAPCALLPAADAEAP